MGGWDIRKTTAVPLPAFLREYLFSNFFAFAAWEGRREMGNDVTAEFSAKACFHIRKNEKEEGVVGLSAKSFPPFLPPP